MNRDKANFDIFRRDESLKESDVSPLLAQEIVNDLEAALNPFRCTSSAQACQSMSHTRQTKVGLVVSLWRYPRQVHDGRGTERPRAQGTWAVGHRAYALVDSSDGKVATAKNP